MNKDPVSQIERWGFVFLDRNWGIRVKFVYFVNNVPYLSRTDISGRPELGLWGSSMIAVRFLYNQMLFRVKTGMLFKL